MKVRIKKKFFLFLLLPVLICILTACSESLVQREQPERDASVLLSQQQSIGQTFTSEYNGLSGIIIYIDQVNNGVGDITLHLRKGPMETTDLRISKLNLQDIAVPGYYSFKFPPLTDSSHSDYYFLLDLHGIGSVTIGTTNQENYLDGVLYQNNLAQKGQINFSLIHNAVYLFIGLMREVGKWLGWLLICFFLFIVPGWAMLSMTWPLFGKLNWLEKLGLGIGVSLAIYTILMLIADQLKIKMGAFFAWLPMIIGLIILIWQNYKEIPQLFSRLSNKRNVDTSISKRRALPWAGISILALIILIFIVRFWAIRTIDVPMWGDSVHHTVIAQLILDNKGLFTSWDPYASYRSMTVQYGFSAHVAIFAWLTGLPSYTAALIIGQIINGLAILTLIPLAYRLSPRNSWAVAATLIFAGLISPMPAFYVNWGRFAQLDAQAILPVAIWLTIEFLDSDKWLPLDYLTSTNTSKTGRLRRLLKEFFQGGLKYYWIPALIIAAVIVAMGLSSYRLGHFYISFLLTWILYFVLTRKYNVRQWIDKLSRIAVILGFCLILFIPWLLRLVGSSLTGLVQEGMTNPNLKMSMQEAAISLSQIGQYVPYGIIFIIVIACLWSIKQKKWYVLTLIAWVAIMQIFFLGQLIRFPGSTMIQEFAILIWLYIPVSLIIGWFIGDIGSKFQLPVNNLGRVALTVSLVILALYGANKTRLISKPIYSSLVTRPDLRAMAWIEKETPPNSKFLVSSFRYHTTSAVGADAGWWIPLLARRQNTMPPQYALVLEVPYPPNLTNKILNLVFALENTSPASPEGLQLLCNNKITHVYIGQRQVYVGPEARRLYNTDELINSPDFELVYHQDRVYIFALKDDVCHRKT